MLKTVRCKLRKLSLALALITTGVAMTAGVASAQTPFDSSGYLHVSYGCDQVALYAFANDPTIAAYMNLSGGYGYLGDRFYIRRADTWLSCTLTIIPKNPNGIIKRCTGTVEVAGVDYAISGLAITSRQCFTS